ncbi:MAG: hypothetical protein JXK07_09125 [Spirochaetes bacterium]|nr:hypothetical protein [Spirochaetota bacterium]MBN2770805.1 hypothetical protein [Spirochaetota bacterium]
MKTRQKKPMSFKEMLDKYISIKGLDIVVHLKDGKSIELNKNRDLIEDEIVMFDKKNLETRIAIPDVSSIDLYAM